MLNQNFQYFMAMNAPFASTEMKLAPLSDVSDGFVDLILLRGQFGGFCRMASLLTRMETGDYFGENGEIRRDLPIDYLKVKAFEIRPHIKAP